MSKHDMPSSLEETAAHLSETIGEFYEFHYIPSDNYGEERISVIVKYDDWNHKMMGLWYKVPDNICIHDTIDLLVVRFKEAKFHFSTIKPDLVFCVNP